MEKASRVVEKASRVAKGVAKEHPGIRATLARARLARRQVAKGVTLWPLVLAGSDPAARAGGDPAARGVELWPIDEALEDGFVGLRADADGALVRIESRAPAPIWVPGGEPLGGTGRAAGSRVVPPHGSTVVRVRRGDPPCARCSRGLAAAFHAADEPVGFVAAVHERAVALELVLPTGLLARRFAQRIEAWAPWLLAAEEGEEAEGFDSPEELLAAVAAGRHLAGRARAEIVCAEPAMALIM